MPKKKLALKKPVKIVSEPHWDLLQIEHYIEEKYGVDLRDYKSKKIKGDTKSFDFWKWLLDIDDLRNDSYIDLDLEYWLQEKNADYVPHVVKEIAQLFLDEFGEDVMHCWVSW